MGNDDGAAVPPTVIRGDPVALHASTDEKIKEAIISLETVKIMRENLSDCYKREGVNHYEKCRGFAETYLAAIGAKKYSKGGL